MKILQRVLFWIFIVILFVGITLVLQQKTQAATAYTLQCTQPIYSVETPQGPLDLPLGNTCDPTSNPKCDGITSCDATNIVGYHTCNDPTDCSYGLSFYCAKASSGQYCGSFTADATSQAGNQPTDTQTGLPKSASSVPADGKTGKTTSTTTVPADGKTGKTTTTSSAACSTTQRTYDQCGGSCNGTQYSANDSVHVVETLDCNNNPSGSQPFQCTKNQTCTDTCNFANGQCTTGSSTPPSSSTPNSASATDPQYVNMCGSGYLACSSSCNSTYACQASCDPDQKTCNGNGNQYVYKYVCTGKSNECGNGKGTVINSAPPLTGSVSIASGLSCNQTAQLDVFDKNCTDASGNWTCKDNDLKGYMVWYSGACPTDTPTSTPTLPPPPPGGGGPADTPTSVPGGPTSTPTPTPTPAQPTPTPAFSQAMCTCDGMTASEPIIPGLPVTFTANAKVEGANTSLATVKDMTFYIAVGDNTTGTLIGKSPPQATTTSDKVEYQSSYTYTMPAQVQQGAVYRAWAKINCVQKTAMSNPSSPVLVAGASSQNQGFFPMIFSFFTSLFGGNNRAATSQFVPPTPTSTPAGQKSLQLYTFEKASVLQKACSLVRFEFP